MSKKSFILLLACAISIVGGFYRWRAEATRATAAKTEAEILKGLTAEQIKLVLQSQSASDAAGVAAIVEKAETRQAFLKGMREYLALATQARRDGLATEQSFRVNFEHKKNMLLADLYQARLSREQRTFYSVSQAELDSVWSNAENENQFKTVMETMRSIQMAVARERGDQMSFPPLQGESLIKARQNWARTKILSDRAKSDPVFMSRPELPLRFKILEAGILSADYLRKHWAEKVKATEQDISAYLASHPEYDVRRKHEQAVSVLQRARAGEDFAQLASEFSEDRSTKEKGGLFDNIEQGAIWEEVERAALSLEKGQIAERLIETHTGYHIVKLEHKSLKRGKDGREVVTFSLRHILLQKGFEEPGPRHPNIPAPFMTAEEIAKAAIEKEKRDRLVEEVVRCNPVTLPEDFTVELAQGSTTNSLASPNSTANTGPQRTR